MIYLDNAASTPVRQEVLDAMLPYLGQQHGNPSSLHSYGRAAERALAAARRQVASLVNAASPSEILLTSGGTESDNLAVLGAAAAAERRGAPRRIVTTAVEHEAVLEPCRRLAASGFEVVRVPPDRTGRVDAGAVSDAVSDGSGACLVSMMLANNEVGTVQPVADAARLCRGSGAVFHTDAVQAVGKIPVDVQALGVDLLSVSAHKISGPKGAGALYVRRGTTVDPLILGGGQEGGMRSGTENVPAAAGFGRACELAERDLGEAAARTRRLRDRLIAGVAASIPHSACNGPDSDPTGGQGADPSSAPPVLPGTAHFTFLGVGGEDLLLKLDEEGIAASTGSACTVKTQKASHVLEAMGFTHEQVSGSLRLSIGASNTEEEIDLTVSALVRIVADLRRVSPHRAKYGL